MTTDVFPLGNLSWTVTLSPNWSTQVVAAPNGREVRVPWRTQPIWKITLKYEILKSNGAQDLQQIVDFYNNRRGGYDPFPFDLGAATHVPDDNTATSRVIGTGDGATTTFTLLRPRVNEPAGYVIPTDITSVQVNGVETAYTFVDPNVIIFAAPPASGAVVTATYKYYMWTRFASDSLVAEEFAAHFWELKELQLQTVLR